MARLAIDSYAARIRPTLLGRYWAVVFPLLQSGVFALLFRIFVRPNGAPWPYLVFVYVGTLAWWVFAQAVSVAAGCLARNAGSQLHASVPATLVVAAAVTGAFLEALPAVPLLIGIMVLVRGLPPFAPLGLWLPVALGLHIAVTLGLGWLVAAASAFYRAVGLALGPLLNTLMFAAPVIYPSSAIPTSLRTLFLANPMATAIEAYRAAFGAGVPPQPHAVALAGAVAVVLLALGGTTLHRLDGRLHEVV